MGHYFLNPRFPFVKRRSVAAYDPGAFQKQRVTFTTTPRASDHTCGNIVVLHLEKKFAPLITEGRVGNSRFLQKARMTVAIENDSTVNTFLALHRV